MCHRFDSYLRHQAASRPLGTSCPPSGGACPPWALPAAGRTRGGHPPRRGGTHKPPRPGSSFGFDAPPSEVGGAWPGRRLAMPPRGGGRDPAERQMARRKATWRTRGKGSPAPRARRGNVKRTARHARRSRSEAVKTGKTT